MRRNRPLADHYPLPQQRHAGAGSNRTARRNEASARQDVTRLSHDTFSTNGDPSPRPRRPSTAATTSDSVASSSTLPRQYPASHAKGTHAPAWTPRQPVEEDAAQDDKEGFHPPLSARRDGGGVGGVQGTRPLPSSSARATSQSGSRPFYDSGSVLDPLPPPLHPPKVVPNAASYPTRDDGRNLYHRHKFQPVMGRKKPSVAAADPSSGPPGPRKAAYANKPKPTQFVIRQLPAATHVLPWPDEETALPPRQQPEQQHQRSVPAAGTTPAHVASVPKSHVATQVSAPPSSLTSSAASCESHAQLSPEAPRPTSELEARRHVPIPSASYAKAPLRWWAGESTRANAEQGHHAVPAAAPSHTDGFYNDNVYGDDGYDSFVDAHAGIDSQGVPSALSFSTTLQSLKDPPQPSPMKQKDYGFMTPPSVKKVVDPPAQRSSRPDIQQYFSKSDVFSWNDANSSSPRREAGMANGRSQAKAAGITSLFAKKKAVTHSSPSAFWGFEQAATTPTASAPTTARSSRSSSSASPTSVPPRSTSAHPYEAPIVSKGAASRDQTHVSLFARHHINERRVLQSYLVQRSSDTNSRKPQQKLHKQGKKKKPATGARTEQVDVVEQMVPVTATSALTDHDRTQLQHVVEAAARATAAATAATEVLTTRPSTTVPPPPVAPPSSTDTSTTTGDASLRFMTELIRTIIEGKSTAGGGAKGGAPEVKKQDTSTTEESAAAGPCHTLISNAGDPLVLNAVVDYLKHKAARLEGENEELWNYLSVKGPGLGVSPNGHRRAQGKTRDRKRTKRRRHQRSALSSSSSDSDASNPSSPLSSSRGTSISTITASADTDGDGESPARGRRRHNQQAPTPDRHKAKQDHSIKKPKPKKVESIERTGHKGQGSDAANLTKTTLSHRDSGADSVQNNFRTPDRPDSTERRTATNTFFMSPSLSSSTTAPSDRSRTNEGPQQRHTLGHAGDDLHGASTHVKPLFRPASPTPSEKERERQKQRYSAEKDELYSFIHSLEEEEEAAIRAGRGADYGFNDAPFYHNYADNERGGYGGGAAYGANGANAGGPREDSVRTGSSAPPSRFQVPSPFGRPNSRGGMSDVGTTTPAAAAGSARPLSRPPPAPATLASNASFASRGSATQSSAQRAGDRYEKHVQTSAAWADVRDDAEEDNGEDRLTETESEYIRRWRRGEDARRAVPSRYRSPHSQAISPSQRDSFVGGDDSVREDGSATPSTSRATVITLHTHSYYTRRTVQRLQAYVDRLEDTRQRLKEATTVTGSQDASVSAVADGPSGSRLAVGRSHSSSVGGPGARGVPPLYPSRHAYGTSSHHTQQQNAGSVTGSARSHRGSYFRGEYSDPEVDATMNDLDDTDPVDVKFVIQDDGLGSVSKQVIVEKDAGEPIPNGGGGGGIDSSHIFPPSSIAPSSNLSTPIVRRERPGVSPPTPAEQQPSPYSSYPSHGKRKSSPRNHHQGHVHEEIGPTHRSAGVTRSAAPRGSATGEMPKETGNADIGSPLTRENLRHFATTSADRTGAAASRQQSSTSLGAFLDEAVAHSTSAAASRRGEESDWDDTMEAKDEGRGERHHASEGDEGDNPLQKPLPPPREPEHSAATNVSVTASRRTSTPITAALHLQQRKARNPEVSASSAASSADAAGANTQETGRPGKSRQSSTSTASSRFGLPGEEGPPPAQHKRDGAAAVVTTAKSTAPSGPVPSGRPQPIATASTVQAVVTTSKEAHDTFVSLDGLIASPTATVTIAHRGNDSGGSGGGFPNALGRSTNMPAYAVRSSPGIPPFSHSQHSLSSRSPISPTSPAFQSIAQRPSQRRLTQSGAPAPPRPLSAIAIDRDDEPEGEDGPLSRTSLGSRQVSIPAASLEGDTGSRMGKRGSGDSNSVEDVGDASNILARSRRGSGEARAKASPHPSPSPSPPASPSRHRRPSNNATTGLLQCTRAAAATAAARSVSSPPMDNDAVDGEMETDGEESTCTAEADGPRNFRAALSASPLSDTQADELTSPP